MNFPRLRRLVPLLLLAWSPLSAAPAGPAPLHLEWAEGPEYPMGIQDSALGVVHGVIVSAGGFTRHPKDVAARFPEAFGGARHGFTALTFVYDPARPAEGWTRIADLPGPARQGALTAVVDEAMYVIGGFSYTAPYTYRAVWRLTREHGQWRWTDSGADLPWPACEGSAVVIGSKIYVLAAADFYAPGGDDDRNFFTEAGRGGSPVGRALLVLDTRDPAAGWRRLADLPGVPRAFASVAAVAGRIYVLGGLHAPLRTGGTADLHAWYFNAAGAWHYDPSADRWERLAPVAESANARAVAVGDRYLVLIGGFKYAETWQEDGSRRAVYSGEELRLTERQRGIDATMPAAELMRAEVSVYDTVTGRLAPLAPLLDPTSWPMAVSAGAYLYCLGGEGGRRLWHPATFQIGRIRLPAGAPATK